MTRFTQTSHATALQHAHIASIYGFEHDGTHRFLVMELVEGEDLGARIQRGTLPLEETIQISRQIALGALVLGINAFAYAVYFRRRPLRSTPPR